MFRIRKNDMVKVTTGESRGKTGKVLKVFPDKNTVIVEGVSFIKRHMRKSQKNPQGGIIEKEAPINVSKVILIHTDEPTKVGYRFLKDGKKVRYSKKTDEVIDSIS
ncbi:MAG: 50S ribosomal protein L24 [Candidatus Marinimicrobia bacterium CG08_land_8_20_14_0_20_45_22]|nr:MAG: 50S ribosomal protein L24 [Candidatus Marinimicrobia bacterium CG08_land_8_20_14_0_20_45_22]